MKKNLLDRIDIKTPCNENWEEMNGNDNVRFCSHCSKDVYDLSSMTRGRAEQLVRDSEGRLCVRYVRDARGKVANAQPRHIQISRRAAVATSVLATSLTLSTLAYSQSRPVPLHADRNAVRESILQKDRNFLDPFTISGVVQDTSGAVIPGAHVTLRTPKTGMVRSTTTNNAGRFEFSNVERGVYEIEVMSPGFKKLIVRELAVDKTVELEQPLALDAAEVSEELMGAVGFIDEPVLITSASPEVSGEVQPRPFEPIPVSKKTDRKKNKKKLPK